LFASFTDAIEKSAHTINGQVSCGTQYHFHIETQVLYVAATVTMTVMSAVTSQWFRIFYSLQACVCIPEDDSYTVYSSTQWINGCQNAVATVLGVQDNRYV